MATTSRSSSLLNYLIWQVDLPNSIDGEPLVTKVSELYADFPYERLPKDSLVGFLQRPFVPLAFAAFYILMKPVIKYLVKVFGITGTSNTFRAFVAMHNFVLAVFSFFVLVNTWSCVLNHFFERGWKAVYCDKDGSMWNSGFGAWHNLFFYSKFYDLLDTLILLMKNKKPSLLQVYHHAGILIMMWGTAVTQGAWVIFMVLQNSAIHTAMYSYYLVKTLYPNCDIKIAKYLTAAQIAQFLIGNLGSIGVFIMGEDCDTQASRFVLFWGQSYVYGLILLFAAFAANKYRLKMKVTPKGKNKAA